MHQTPSQRVLKTLFFVSTVMFLTLAVFPVAAQIAPLDEGDCGDFGIACDPDANSESFIALVLKVLRALLALVGLLAALAVIYGGVLYIISAGDSSRTTQAKNTIIYALIGLVVIGLSFVVINFVIRAVTA